jgi:hypothetical protein
MFDKNKTKKKCFVFEIIRRGCDSQHGCLFHFVVKFLWKIVLSIEIEINDKLPSEVLSR